MRELVTKLPGADFAGLLDYAVFGLAEMIESALGEEVEGERQAGEAIGEDAVVDIAAGGVVAGERRGPLPGFAAAARVLVVAIAEGLMCGEPETLGEKKREKHRRDPLGKIEVEAADPGCNRCHEVWQSVSV